MLPKYQLGIYEFSSEFPILPIIVKQSICIVSYPKVIKGKKKYLDKSSITLFQIAIDIQYEKLNNEDINENTYVRNLESIEYIKKILG